MASAMARFVAAGCSGPRRRHALEDHAAPAFGGQALELDEAVVGVAAVGREDADLGNWWLEQPTRYVAAPPRTTLRPVCQHPSSLSAITASSSISGSSA